MPRAALQPQEVEDFREQLCRVATRRFAEYGHAGVSLRQLAAELGCSPMTPYRYFRDREAIIAAVRAAAFARFADAMAAAAATVTDPVARLGRLGEAYLRHARTDPHGYRIMFELAQPRARDYPALDREEARAWAVLRDAVAAAVEAGAVAGDPDIVAHVLWAGLHGLAALDLAGKLRLKRREVLAGPMMAALIRGVAVEASPPTDQPRRARAPRRRRTR